MLTLDEYRDFIHLELPFTKETTLLSVSEKENIIDRLLKSLNDFVQALGNLNAHQNYTEKRQLLRAVLNTVPAFTLSETSIDLLNKLLQSELAEKESVDILKISSNKVLGSTHIKLWKGDITTLDIDAIVNAANSAMQGCFQPLHACIDNAIHSVSGVQLRDDCAKIIKLQKHAEPTGTAKITRAYNLPSKFVLHTVGPIVQGNVTLEHEELLGNAYKNCLDTIKEMGNIKSIAFCCISTGVFGYPPHLAAIVAYQSVLQWLEQNPNILDTVIFNVFSTSDENIYKTILQS